MLLNYKFLFIKNFYVSLNHILDYPVTCVMLRSLLCYKVCSQCHWLEFQLLLKWELGKNIELELLIAICGFKFFSRKKIYLVSTKSVFILIMKDILISLL